MRRDLFSAFFQHREATGAEVRDNVLRPSNSP